MVLRKVFKEFSFTFQTLGKIGRVSQIYQDGDLKVHLEYINKFEKW